MSGTASGTLIEQPATPPDCDQLAADVSAVLSAAGWLLAGGLRAVSVLSDFAARVTAAHREGTPMLLTAGPLRIDASAALTLGRRLWR